MYQQVRCHDDEVLFCESQCDTQYDGKGHRCGGECDTGAFLHKLIGTETLGDDETDRDEVQEGCDDDINDNRDEQSENPSTVPL